MTEEKVTDVNMRSTDAMSPVIVGIGASAGGLEVLQQFFQYMPDDSGISFVVVQHLSPDYKSMMADILGKYTNMTVIQAENEMEVLPNTVYLIPPKKNMTLKDRKLILTELVHGSINHPIDMFFASLAQEQKERAVAVVMSGTGSDGTSGIKSVKEEGGFVIVQSPETAKFDGMPRCAINTGVADFILPPDKIVDEILNFCHNTSMIKTDDKEPLFTNEEVFSRIYPILKKASGIDFSNYKRTTVLRRIERRMVVTHSVTLLEYVRILSKNQEEANILAKEILIGVTSFFRDPQFFEKLKRNVVYNIVERCGEDEPIRVWSAGCSTGEEAYSIAILFREVMESLNVHRDVKIFATDVDTKAIEKAGKGIYTESIIENVSSERLAKFFSKKNDHYIVTKDIRRMIIFAPHNMLSDPPFGKLDLIICRNVMIYFQPVLQRALFGIFHTALKNNAYLFLGKSETAGEFSNVFIPICGAEKIYAHRGEGKVSEFTPTVFNIPNFQSIPQRVTGISGKENSSYISESGYMRFMEKFLPASVVVNEINDVTHFFGNYLDYMSIAPGKATFNFFSIINHDLSLVASTALNRCRLEQVTVKYTGIAVECHGERRDIDLVVSPVPGKGTEPSGQIAILFIEHKSSEVDGITEKYDVDTTAARRISDLEQELKESKNDLKSTIGELETVNEELQAANEELLTANEELQSSNEELQSVNEELYTVNTEYQQKLDELTMLTNDLSNFLSSTMIGILFVDSSLNIRKFTEYVGREFQLLDHDVGRSLQIFAHSFPTENIIKDAQDVLKDLVPIDREVTAMNGRYYTLRIAPYRTMENNIRGLVITIIDSLGVEK